MYLLITLTVTREYHFSLFATYGGKNETLGLYYWSERIACAVHYFWDYFSLFLLLSPPHTSSPRRGFPRVMEFYTEFQVTKKIRFGVKTKFGAPPLAPWEGIF